MRKTVIILLSCTVLLLLGYSGYRGYQLWEQNHWMSLARQFAIKGDAGNEFLSLKQALRLNPGSVEACRMMAGLAEAAGSPSAVTWRQKVLELEPDSLDNRLQLAQTAVLVHDYNTAASALAGVDAEGRKNPLYFNILGQLAISSNDLAGAESDFSEASRLDPLNLAPQLSLSSVQLRSTNALDLAQARITLRRISMNSTNLPARMQAERELVIDALRYPDPNTALWYSKDLLQQTNLDFEDVLLRLDVLLQTKDGEYDSYLAYCKNLAASDPSKLTQFGLWLMQNNMFTENLEWLQTLPLQTQTNLPAALMIAQCQIALHHWAGLQKSISTENWGRIEFTRQAYLALALRQQGLYQASKAEWDVAFKSANDQDANLSSLFGMTAEWNWQDEAQQVLWEIVKNYPQEQWAGQQLSAMLYNNGNTRPLMELFSIQANRDPDDLNAKNNLALTAMLLHAQEMNPYDTAQNVYQQAPTNSTFACTYAFSLYLQGKNQEALKVMQKLTPQDLKNTSTDGYYGLILKAVGDNAQANAYLKRSVSGQLLPEERTMFQQALLGL